MMLALEGILELIDIVGDLFKKEIELQGCLGLILANRLMLLKSVSAHS